MFVMYNEWKIKNEEALYFNCKAYFLRFDFFSFFVHIFCVFMIHEHAKNMNKSE